MVANDFKPDWLDATECALVAGFGGTKANAKKAGGVPFEQSLKGHDKLFEQVQVAYSARRDESKSIAKFRVSGGKENIDRFTVCSELKLYTLQLISDYS